MLRRCLFNCGTSLRFYSRTVQFNKIVSVKRKTLYLINEILHVSKVKTQFHLTSSQDKRSSKFSFVTSTCKL